MNKHQKNILKQLREFQTIYTANQKNTISFKREVDYLEMKVSQEGIFIDSDKVKTILEWPDC